MLRFNKRSVFSILSIAIVLYIALTALISSSTLQPKTLKRTQPTIDKVSQTLQNYASTSLRAMLTKSELDLMLTKKFNNVGFIEPKVPRIAYAVMGSSVNTFRTRIQQSTWMKWITTEPKFIFSDQQDDSIGMMTLPEIKNLPSRDFAQHRLLRGLQWLYQHREVLLDGVEWIAMVDDDTWLNVPALHDFLNNYDSRLPIVFGHMWDAAWNDTITFSSGGAGLILSRRSFEILAPALYNQCPFLIMKDVTLGVCFVMIGILKIHSDKFLPWNGVNPLAERTVSLDLVEKLSAHYIDDLNLMRNMTCEAAIHWDWGLDELCQYYQYHSFGIRGQIKV